MEWFSKHRKKLILVAGYIALAILLDLSSGAFVLQTGLAICYPPAGLYLATILLLGWTALPLAFLNPVFSVLVTLHSPDIPLTAVLGIGIVSMISPALSLIVLKRAASQGIRLRTLSEVMLFIVVVALALIVESVAAASVYVLTGLSSLHSFGTVTVDWWISNSIPYFTLTPVILLWHQNQPNIRSLLNRRTVIQTLWIAACVPLAVWIALFSNGNPSVSRLYVVFLPIVWAALIGGLTGAAWISLCVTASVLVLAPALLPGAETVVEAQFSLLIAILTGLTTGMVVTERRQAEINLRNSEEQYRNIFDNSIDGIFQSTPAGDFISVNPAMAAMYGYDSPQDMLRTVTDISSQLYVKPDLRNELRHRLANGEQIIGFESLDYRKDNSTFWTSMNVQAIYKTDGTILYYEGTVENITLRKKIEAEREQLIRELAAKNLELEQFTYTVSHDLKAPLITIKGFLGFLEKDIVEARPDRIHNDVQRIHGAVDKMHALLTELLALSRIGRMLNEPENIPLEELVKDVLDIIHGQLEKHQAAVQVQPNLPTIHGDRRRLTEVLQNLLDNAAKYMGAQTQPLIEIGQQGEEEGKPILFVRDNGMGIAPAYHERIFGLFNKLDARSEGTGIGLTLVKRITEFHGGRIWLESELGKGATFYFTLPINK